MGEKVSEIEENTLRVLLSTLRKHDPDSLQRIVFDVLLAGVGEGEARVFLASEDDEEDEPIVAATIIAIRGTETSARFFAALQAAQLDEAEDTELS